MKWKPWQRKMPTEELLREWFLGTKNNVAIICSGMVLFDCDDPEKAGLVIGHCGDTPHKVRTPRGGIHLGFRKRKGCVVGNHVKIKGMPIDIRSDGAHAVCPWSRNSVGVAYEWVGCIVPAAALPPIDASWLRARAPKKFVIQNVSATSPLPTGVWRGRPLLRPMVSSSA